MHTPWPWPHRIRAIVLCLALVGVVVTAEQVSAPNEVVSVKVPDVDVLAAR